MTTTTAPTTTTSVAVGTRTVPVWKTGVKAAAIAAVATTAYAAVSHAAGVSYEISGKAIPLLGFGQLTFVFSLLGIGIAKLSRTRSRFVQIAVGLTLVSFLPDALANAATATRLALMVSHAIAAVIVIPRLASRLAD